MKIQADSSPYIQKSDTIDLAARRKSGKRPTETLSTKSMAKLASIVTRDYRCGLGAAFTGKHVPVPPRDNAYAQLKLESLRNDLTALRGQLAAGSCIHRYLGEVLHRLPVPLPLVPLTQDLGPVLLPRPFLMPTPEAGIEPKPDYAEAKGIRLVGPRVDGPKKSVTIGFERTWEFPDHHRAFRTSEPVNSAAAMLQQLLDDGPGAGYSVREKEQFWGAALSMEHIEPYAFVAMSVAQKRAESRGEQDVLPSMRTLIKVIESAGGLVGEKPLEHSMEA